MKLSEQDKEYLMRIGHPNEDLAQIERAIHNTTYTAVYEIGSRRISLKEAIALLGKESFLNGLSRSAFHFTAVRDVGNTEDKVFFDSSRLFNKHR